MNFSEPPHKKLNECTEWIKRDFEGLNIAMLENHTIRKNALHKIRKSEDTTKRHIFFHHCVVTFHFEQQSVLVFQNLPYNVG